MPHSPNTAWVIGKGSGLDRNRFSVFSRAGKCVDSFSLSGNTRQFFTFSYLCPQLHLLISDCLVLLAVRRMTTNQLHITVYPLQIPFEAFKVKIFFCPSIGILCVSKFL